ncbi:DUF5954 family protein [Streptomyces roseicoloratus]|uniref:DUF5954 family protein n=1 Tax=Streptomyces roseicoloratus TaxID=2508722 RepID=UPI001009870F|nr:DUF5954 family protein [Streptomyces roseicoloratus]
MDDDWERRIAEVQAGLVRSGDPVAWVTEADAVESAMRYPGLAVRGATFGVVARDVGDDGPWRIVEPVRCGMPQEARDCLQSRLFFRAKDDTDDPAVRRELIAAVKVLERKPVDRLDVLGVRYRVVRADEFTRIGDDGLEPPRPTDPEPVFRVWEGDIPHRSPDDGALLAPDRSRGPMSEALRFGMRSFSYTGARYPAAVRRDSERAVVSHPDVALLPVAFGVVEREGSGWLPHGSLLATPHEARQALYDMMVDFWPHMYKWDDAQREPYRRAGELFRAAGRADKARVAGREFRICRVERMVRFDPDGPEGPRPSDVDEYGPQRLHPRMDEDGTLHHEE